METILKLKRLEKLAAAKLAARKRNDTIENIVKGIVLDEEAYNFREV